MQLRILDKKASIPVAIIVILTIALFTFTLLSFSLSKNSINDKIGKAAAQIEKFNLQEDSLKYLGADNSKIEVSLVENKKFLGMAIGDKFVAVSVKRTG